MSMSAGQAKLKDAYKALMAQWERSLEGWDDQRRDGFRQRYIEELGSRLEAAMGAIGRLGEAYAQARRECEPER